MLTSIPVEKNKYHCIDSMFLTVAHYFKREVGLMAVGSWGFDYKPNLQEKKFGDKLFSGMVMLSREALNKYHGIEVDWHENVSWEELKNAIENHINNNRPLGISCDGYFCPWNTAYHKVKVDHYCLINGYDPIKKKYKCIDSYFAKVPNHIENTNQIEEDFLLGESDLKQGCNEYISFKLVKPVLKYSLKKVFRDVQLGIEDFQNRKNTFEKMEQFGKDLAKNLDIDNETINCNGQIEVAKLYRIFVQLSQRRQNFADSLLFLKDNASDVTIEMADSLEKVSEEFNKIANQWTKMGVLMIKLYLTKKETIREKMGTLVQEIARDELELLKKVINIGEMAK